MNHRANTANSKECPVGSGDDNTHPSDHLSQHTEGVVDVVQNKYTRKTVYLHIGWEKTGSSAIQAFCGRNQHWLRERCFDYPMIGTRPQHITLYYDLKSRHPRRVARIMEEFRSVVESSTQPAMIISHEALHLCNPQMFRELFDGHDVRVIAYIRRPDIAVISHFVTVIRFGYLSACDLSKTIRMYIERYLTDYDYYWQLELFAAVFGRENMIIRPYHPDHLVGGQSVSDFMYLLGIDDLSNSLWPEVSVNPSPDIEQFEFALRCARLLRDLPRVQVQMITKQICDAILAKSKGREKGHTVDLFVSRKVKDRINTFFEPSMNLLYQRYFNARVVFDQTTRDALGFEHFRSERFEDLRDCVMQTACIPRSILNRFTTLKAPSEREIMQVVNPDS